MFYGLKMEDLSDHPEIVVGAITEEGLSSLWWKRYQKAIGRSLKARRPGLTPGPEEVLCRFFTPIRTGWIH